ncbi:MAG: DUF2149 domain-containing protein [Desulforudis sp.]|nr:MAG: DUF2149 domain-containing protein [Desulforudis sp.]
MLRRRKKRWLVSDGDNDPLRGLANMVDVMLVFVCGLLVALVLSWNLQDIFTSEMDAARRQELLRTIQQVVTVEKGRELEELPNTGPGSGSGYQELGTVYQDPETGKLIMIEN